MEIVKKISHPKKLIISILSLSLLTSGISFAPAVHAADPMIWTSGAGVSNLDWSRKSTVTSQTGWLLEWQKKGEATWNSYVVPSVSTRTASVCMSYNNAEETYKISTLVGSTAANAYSNTWTYTGALYTTYSPLPTCVNQGEKDVVINFFANAPTGTTSSGSMNQLNLPGITNFPLPPNTFSVPSYTFSTWNTVAGGSGTSYLNQSKVDFTNISGTLNLYAQWSAVPQKTVVFNSNYGTPTTVNQSASATANLRANSFTRSGYSFSNWNTISAGIGTPYANLAAYSFAADTTLYAQWSANQYSFNGTTASGSTASQTYADTIMSAPNNGFTVPATYTFGGWCSANPVSLGATCASVSGTTYASGSTLPIPASSTVTLYAIWSASAHTVTFNSNYGTPSTSTQAASVATNLTANSFSRSGYTFAGWSTSSGVTIVVYADKASYTFASDTILYAQWTALTPNLSPTAQTISGQTGSAITNSTAFTPSNFSGSVTYSVTTGALPAGLILSSSTGVISGTPTAVSSASITITGTSGVQTATSGVTFSITAPAVVTCYTVVGTQLTNGSSCTGAVVIDSSVTTIGYAAFQNNKNITSVSIPSGVTSIGDRAFSGASNLAGTLNIPSGVTTIGAFAFYTDSRLNGTLTIPNTVTSIGTYAFFSTHFSQLIFEPTSTLTAIGDHVFESMSLSSVTIPDSVQSIGWGAFYNDSLTTLTLGSGVSSIGMDAFTTSQFTSLTLNSALTSIADRAFQNSRLTSLNLNSALTSIGASAFYSSPITSLTLDSALTSIGASAFYSAPLTSLTLYGALTSIGANAFASARCGTYSNSSSASLTGTG